MKNKTKKKRERRSREKFNHLIIWRRLS